MENLDIDENNNINSKDEIVSHVEVSLRQLKKLMISYPNNEETISKADKLAYWLEAVSYTHL